QSASPARSTAGVAAQKKRLAACAAETAGSGSRRRDQRKSASVLSTASAAPLIRVQRTIGAIAGAEKSMGARAYSTHPPAESMQLRECSQPTAASCRTEIIRTAIPAFIRCAAATYAAARPAQGRGRGDV